MAMPFESMHYNIVDRSSEELQDIGVQRSFRGKGFLAAANAPPGGFEFTTEEAAARFYLNRLFERNDRAVFRGLAAPDEPSAVPDMRLRDSNHSPITDTWTVRFSQASCSVPIFGSHMVVELDRERQLLTVDGQVGDVQGVSPIASVSPAEALSKIATFVGADAGKLGALPAPDLVYFFNDASLHLAFHFKAVPGAPVGFVEDSKTHGLSRSPALYHPRLDYLVDAHDAQIIRYWSSVPTVANIPSLCTGTDEDGVAQTFFGTLLDNHWIMSDPMRQIQTCDMALKDIDRSPLSSDAIQVSSQNFDSKAAVSAHVNATKVYDFYRSVLVRDGIDDKGMQLLSYVNCTMSAAEDPPQWRNAVWYNRRMWYGQQHDASGALKSFSRYLDVIAHELTHGVTEFTADLAYMDQSGALNESFSDIFGIIIKNWDATNPTTGGDVSTWNWEIGSGLGKGGLPLRDLQNPARTGDPDHITKYNPTRGDNGGVHTNSNIHNKAAHNVLVATDTVGGRHFSPREVAVLYYLCLTRLYKLATFVQARDTLINVASTYYAGHPSRDVKLEALRAAYREVGI